LLIVICVCLFGYLLAALLERLREFVDAHTTARQFGIPGEPRVNVLELNRDLDTTFAVH
jgi:K+-transporting ATPase c subunit